MGCKVVITNSADFEVKHIYHVYYNDNKSTRDSKKHYIASDYYYLIGANSSNFGYDFDTYDILGEIHRIDGPAIEIIKGNLISRWGYNGKITLNKEEWFSWLTNEEKQIAAWVL